MRVPIPYTKNENAHEKNLPAEIALFFLQKFFECVCWLVHPAFNVLDYGAHMHVKNIYSCLNYKVQRKIVPENYGVHFLYKFMRNLLNF